MLSASHIVHPARTRHGLHAGVNATASHRARFTRDVIGACAPVWPNQALRCGPQHRDDILDAHGASVRVARAAGQLLAPERRATAAGRALGVHALCGQHQELAVELGQCQVVAVQA